MSDHIYRVRYDQPALSSVTTTKSSVDNQSRIRELLQQLGAIPIPARRGANSMEKIEAKALGTTAKPIELPKDMLEVPVPENLTAPTALNETLLAKAINESELLVTVTDASLQRGQCDQIVRDFAVRLYEKGTGRKVTAEEVKVETIGILTYSICQCCRSQIHGLPHKCSCCGRTFCHRHAAPAEHECAIAATVPTQKMTRTIATHRRPTVKQAVTKSQSKVKVERVPCG